MTGIQNDFGANAKTSAVRTPAAPFTISAQVSMGRSSFGDGQNHAISNGNGVTHK